jgi:hypothetical protein
MKISAAMMMSELSSAWSCSDFGAPELQDYARPVITGETRRGVALLSLVALLFLGLATAMSAAFDLGASYTYTYSLLCALALHIHLSSSRVGQLRELYLLAMLLLVACGSALVLLLSVAVLIMLVRGPDVAARIDAALRTVSVRLEATLPGVAPTVSLGLVGLPARGCPSFDQAYKLADELLYQARHAGGNAIRCGQAAGVHA